MYNNNNRFQLTANYNDNEIDDNDNDDNNDDVNRKKTARNTPQNNTITSLFSYPQGSNIQREERKKECVDKKDLSFFFVGRKTKMLFGRGLVWRQAGTASVKNENWRLFSQPHKQPNDTSSENKQPISEFFFTW